MTTPDDERFDVTDPALAARLGYGAHVIKQDRGVFDASPLSLVTTQTIEHLAAMVGRGGRHEPGQLRLRLTG